MSNGELAARTPSYRDRIAVLPGEPRIAYRPGVVILKGEAARAALGGVPSRRRRADLR